MGNCNIFCSNNITRLKGDIAMDKLIVQDDKSKRVPIYNLYKIKFLQSQIKNFLNRKKNHKSNNSKDKNIKQYENKSPLFQENKALNSKIHYHYNSHSKKSSSKSHNFNNIKTTKNSYYTKSNINDSSPKNQSPKNKSPKSRSSKNIAQKNRNKIISFPKKFEIKTKNMNKNNDNDNLIKKSEKYKKNIDENSNDNFNNIIIPNIKPTLFDKNEIFKNDPFRNGIGITKNKNDPRDAINDNNRKIYPIVIEDNISYIGEWKNGKRDGIGLLHLENEYKYFGQFSENNIVGYGILFHQNGDSYKGQWKNYQADGWGIYFIKNGAFIRGMWSHNKPNGFGIERWPRQSVYSGEYNNGNKDGIGILNFNKKAWYEGEFKNGVISGIGSFFFEDGRKYQGTFKNNKIDGFGCIIWPDKKIYEGEFKDDKKEGFGIYKIGKKIFMGIWCNNKLEGKVIIIEEGKLKKQLWENGRALKNLSHDTPIIFEKYAEDYKNKGYE